MSGPDKVGNFRSLQKYTLEMEPLSLGRYPQPHAGEKAFDSFQWCPVLLHPSLDTWQKLPKAPKQQLPEPGSRRSLSPEVCPAGCRRSSPALCQYHGSFIPETPSVSLARPSGLLVG